MPKPSVAISAPRDLSKLHSRKLRDHFGLDIVFDDVDSWEFDHAAGVLYLTNLSVGEINRRAPRMRALTLEAALDEMLGRPSVVVYGEQRVGLRRDARAIADHYGLAAIVDSRDGWDVRDPVKPRGVLYLTNGYRVTTVYSVAWVSYETAKAAVDAAERQRAKVMARTEADRLSGMSAAEFREFLGARTSTVHRPLDASSIAGRFADAFMASKLTPAPPVKTIPDDAENPVYLRGLLSEALPHVPSSYGHLRGRIECITAPSPVKRPPYSLGSTVAGVDFQGRGGGSEGLATLILGETLAAKSAPVVKKPEYATFRVGSGWATISLLDDVAGVALCTPGDAFDETEGRRIADERRRSAVTGWKRFAIASQDAGWPPAAMKRAEAKLAHRLRYGASPDWTRGADVVPHQAPHMASPARRPSKVRRVDWFCWTWIAFAAGALAAAGVLPLLGVP